MRLAVRIDHRVGGVGPHTTASLHVGGGEARPQDLGGTGRSQDLRRELASALDAAELLGLEVRQEQLVAVLVDGDRAVVVVVGHVEQPDPAAVLADGIDEGLTPHRAVLVGEAGRETDGVLVGGRLDREPTVLVGGEVVAVAADRSHHVGVLGLVEEAEHEGGRVEPEVAADVGVGDVRADQDLWRPQRAGRHHDYVGLNFVAFAGGLVRVLDAGRLETAVVGGDEDLLHERVRAYGQGARQPVALDVGVHRRLAGVGRAPLQARPALLAVLVDVGADRLERGAHGFKALLRRLDARFEVPIGGAVAYPEVALDPVVVRIEVLGRDRVAGGVGEPGGRVPLVELALRGAQGDLGVDRGAAPDALAADHHDRPDGRVAGREREVERPPVVVGGAALPAGEVGRDVVASRLEQQYVAALLRELAGKHATTGPRADHDDLEVLARAHAWTPTEAPPPGAADTPKYDQSFLIRMASGEWKSISS